MLKAKRCSSERQTAATAAEFEKAQRLQISGREPLPLRTICQARSCFQDPEGGTAGASGSVGVSDSLGVSGSVNISGAGVVSPVSPGSLTVLIRTCEEGHWAFVRDANGGCQSQMSCQSPSLFELEE